MVLAAVVAAALISYQAVVRRVAMALPALSLSSGKGKT
jgi:hypothetical protein